MALDGPPALPAASAAAAEANRHSPDPLCSGRRGVSALRETPLRTPPPPLPDRCAAADAAASASRCAAQAPSARAQAVRHAPRDDFRGCRGQVVPGSGSTGPSSSALLRRVGAALGRKNNLPKAPFPRGLGGASHRRSSSARAVRLYHRKAPLERGAGGGLGEAQDSSHLARSRRRCAKLPLAGAGFHPLPDLPLEGGGVFS